MSKGAQELFNLMRKVLPDNAKLVTEHHVGEGLRLDVFSPQYMLAGEFHGRQHFEYVEHFHKNRRGFWDAQQRDVRKKELCMEQGIALIEFDYRDDMTLSAVSAKVQEAMEKTPSSKEETESSEKSDWKIKQQERYNEYKRKQRKQAYKRKKKWRDNRRD